MRNGSEDKEDEDRGEPFVDPRRGIRGRPLFPGKGVGPGFSFSVVNLSPVPCGKRAGGIIC